MQGVALSRAALIRIRSDRVVSRAYRLAEGVRGRAEGGERFVKVRGRFGALSSQWISN